MFRTKSLLDQDGDIDKNNGTVAIMRDLEGKDPEQAFLMVEAVNPLGKIVFKRYDFLNENNSDNHFKIGIDERVVEPENAKEAYASILNNHSILSKVWNVRREKIEELHNNILASEKNPGNYNPLGSDSLLPKIADCVRAIPPEIRRNTKRTIQTAVDITMRVTLGEKASTTANLMTNLATNAYNTTPNEIKEPITNKFNECAEGISGRRVRNAVTDVVKNSTKPFGDNSFTWARNMLYSINDVAIKRDLPRKASDIISAVTSLHLPSQNEQSDHIKSLKM